MSQRYSVLNQITPANVTNLEQKWVVQNQVFGAWQSTPLVVDGMMYVTQRPNDVDGARRQDRPRVLDLPSPHAGRQRACCGANNRGVAILGDIALHGHARRPPDRARCADRRKPCGTSRSPTYKDGYSITHGAAHRQGQGARRRRRRRVRHPRLRGGVRREDRQGSLAVLHDSRAGRAAATTRGKSDAWKTGGGPVWVTGSYDPDAQPDLLGRRQSRARLESRTAPRRQPVHRFGHRARRRHRQAAVALPVHAERRLRLRLGAGAGARRHRLAGHAAQGDDVGATATATSTCSTARPASSCSASRS